MINDIPRCLQKNNFKIPYVLKQFHIKIFYSDLRLKENQSDKKQIQWFFDEFFYIILFCFFQFSDITHTTVF